MATTICCPKSIKACALRITRQNECDVALGPLVPNSRIETAGFMTLSLSPDVEAGEDITTKNACGDICIRDKDCDRLKGFDLELTLCGVPPHVIEMLTGGTLLLDGSGNVKGLAMRESKDAVCLDSLALEFWSKNADKGVCSIDGLTQNLWVHWVLPRTINWEISGGLEFSTGPLEIVLSGYAENNPLWWPSFPDGLVFPGYTDPADPTSVPTAAIPGDQLQLPPCTQTYPDPWTLADQSAVQAGGPMAWSCVPQLPPCVNDCAYVPDA